MKFLFEKDIKLAMLYMEGNMPINFDCNFYIGLYPTISYPLPLITNTYILFACKDALSPIFLVNIPYIFNIRLV